MSLEEHNVMIIESLDTSRATREKMMQILFEKFGAFGVQFQLASVCALFACGRSTGAVIDLGHGTTDIVPVVEGYYIPRAIKRLPIGGVDLDEFMARQLRNQGVSLRLT